MSERSIIQVIPERHDNVYRVKMSVTCQSFILAYEGETQEDGEWVAKQLAQMLARAGARVERKSINE